MSSFCQFISQRQCPFYAWSLLHWYLLDNFLYNRLSWKLWNKTILPIKTTFFPFRNSKKEITVYLTNRKFFCWGCINLIWVAVASALCPFIKWACSLRPFVGYDTVFKHITWPAEMEYDPSFLSSSCVALPLKCSLPSTLSYQLVLRLSSWPRG